MRILALDTSCDESAAAIVCTEQWKLLADEVASHAAVMAQYGGVVPELAAREHLVQLPVAVEAALAHANFTPQDIDLVAATNRPGLIGALLVGVSYGKALSFQLGKPFRAVNHLAGHLYSPLLATLDGSGKTPPAFPWIALVVSGGHTELILVERFGSARRLGGTLDDAAGEAFDKIGKMLGFPYPAGPAMDRFIRAGGESTGATPVFRKVKTQNALDFSYSGLKTAVSLAAKAADLSAPTQKLTFAKAAQEAIVDQLVDRANAALAAHPGTSLVLSGGVACNSRLREKLPHAFFPAPRHCSDNAAMIALVAALEDKNGLLTADPLDVSVLARDPDF